MHELHFLRPWWLLALPAGTLLILCLFRMRANGGAWRAVIDRSLQPLVLTGAGGLAGRTAPLAAALAALAVATLALAGPAWERLPVPVFRSDEALVLALDLSRSMDAADLEPSRIAHAKLKLLSLLERRTGGQTGLVVFSGHAFTVTPLTSDTRTIAALVSALSTDIMPSGGSRIEAALDSSATLLRRASVAEGRILVISDAPATPSAVQRARELRAEGYEISVLGVGTAEGAPIPQRDGGFLTDGRDNVVVPRLDAERLARLAAAGGGRYATLTASEADLEQLLPPQPAGTLEAREDAAAPRTEAWRDGGLLFALLLLPLAALGFRRGWIALWLCALLLPAPHASAQPAVLAESAGAPGAAAEETTWRDRWLSLWQRADQRGAAAMAEQRPGLAARLFEDPEWRAAAQYRAGDYAESAAALAGIDSAAAHYNRGNALARAGEIRPAIEAYERALALDPRHEDARFNRDLLEALLAEEPPPNAESAEDRGQDPQQATGEDGEESPAEEDSGDAAQPQQADRASGAEGEPRDGEAGASRQAADDETSAERRDRPQGDEGREEGEARQAPAEQAAPGPEDIEQWASEQAADQWLRRVRQDPGGLLRRKFLYQYRQLGIDQDGNPLWPEEEAEPW